MILIMIKKLQEKKIAGNIFKILFYIIVNLHERVLEIKKI